MPTRMIREGLLDSERYARVSDAARLLFVHLMLLADDFGCVSVSATFLRRRCFYDSPSDERIARLICELVDVDLIRTYEIDRACLAFIPKFRQRLYRSTLKHAMPPESLYKDDLDALEKFNEIKKDKLKTPVVAPEYPVLPPPEVKRSEEKEALSGARLVLEYLNLLAGRSFEAVPANLELISSRLKDGASVEQCKAVVSCKVKQWKGTEWAKYLRPATLFNRTKYAQYVGEIGAAPERQVSI